MSKFNKKDIEFFLPQTFKGLSKKYMLDCIFDETIQNKWQPEEGDIIVGETGNVFVISGSYPLAETIGGHIYYFGGHSCNRTGGRILDSTACYSMNKGGLVSQFVDNELKMVSKLGHSKISDFRFVPYPHEKNRF